MRRPTLNVAVAQFEAVEGGLEANAVSHVKLLAAAATAGADLVVFPELSLPGYAANVLADDPTRCVTDLGGPILARVRQACHAGGVAAVVGCCLRAEGGLTLSSIVIDRAGGLQARYDKQHLDSEERSWFVRGAVDCLVDLDGWRLGLGICYDASFPEHARGLARAGADVYVVAGAFPAGDSDHRRSIYLPARALENTMYLAFANYSGSHGVYSFCGRSALYSPDGRVLASATAGEIGLALATFELAELRETRRRLRMLEDAAEEGS